MNPLFQTYLDFWSVPENVPEKHMCRCGRPDAWTFTYDGLTEILHPSRYCQSIYIWVADTPAPSGRFCDHCLEEMITARTFRFVYSPFHRRKTDLSFKAARSLYYYGARKAQVMLDWNEGRLAEIDFPPMLLECWYGGTPRIEMPERGEIDRRCLYGRGLPFVNDGFDLVWDAAEKGEALTAKDITEAGYHAARFDTRGPEVRLHYVNPDFPTHPLFLHFMLSSLSWDRRDEEAPLCGCGCGQKANDIFAFDGLAEAGFESCFDTHNLIWTASEDPPQGLISDRCMKRFCEEGRFEFVRSPITKRDKPLSLAAAAALFRYGARLAVTAGKWIDDTLAPEALPPMLLKKFRGDSARDLPERNEKIFDSIPSYCPFVGDGVDFALQARQRGQQLTDEDIKLAADAAANSGDRGPEIS